MKLPLRSVVLMLTPSSLHFPVRLILSPGGEIFVASF